jgi:hypothetical protein
MSKLFSGTAPSYIHLTYTQYYYFHVQGETKIFLGDRFQPTGSFRQKNHITNTQKTVLKEEFLINFDNMLL